jgi:hypothetical protein
VLAFSGISQPASSSLTVPSRRSVKSTTWVPCEYQPMKIRFCPGTCWNTCAVHRLACGWVRIGARKIALPPSGVRA